MKLLGVSGGLSRKTLIAIKKALDSAKRYDNTVETEAISLNEYDIQFCDARDPNKYEGDARLVIDKFVETDALLLGTRAHNKGFRGASTPRKEATEGKPEWALQ